MCCAPLFIDPNEPLKHKANETISFKEMQVMQHWSAQVNITQPPCDGTFAVEHDSLNICKAVPIKTVF